MEKGKILFKEDITIQQQDACNFKNYKVESVVSPWLFILQYITRNTITITWLQYVSNIIHYRNILKNTFFELYMIENSELTFQNIKTGLQKKALRLWNDVK